jgi:rare lipoprotein A (peptidoglycan hydrolase)
MKFRSLRFFIGVGLSALSSIFTHSAHSKVVEPAKLDKKIKKRDTSLTSSGSSVNYRSAGAAQGPSPTSEEKKVKSRTDEPDVVSTSTGKASWYGGRWIGRKTANGEIYRAGDMTAAHKTLPFGTRVRVTDQNTGESTIVRINNRGPYVRGRVIDLSEAAAKELGMKNRGVARVKLEVLADEEKPANDKG